MLDTPASARIRNLIEPDEPLKRSDPLKIMKLKTLFIAALAGVAMWTGIIYTAIQLARLPIPELPSVHIEQRANLRV